MSPNISFPINPRIHTFLCRLLHLYALHICNIYLSIDTVYFITKHVMRIQSFFYHNILSLLSSRTYSNLHHLLSCFSTLFPDDVYIVGISRYRMCGFEKVVISLYMQVYTNEKIVIQEKSRTQGIPTLKLIKFTQIIAYRKISQFREFVDNELLWNTYRYSQKTIHSSFNETFFQRFSFLSNSKSDHFVSFCLYHYTPSLIEDNDKRVKPHK